MKKNLNIIKRYVEAIVYSILLVVAIYLCLINNIYITMILIAFITGMIGQIIFGKRIMTSFFAGVLSIILLQIKLPAQLVNNLVITFQITFLTLIGECFGWSVKRLYRLIRNKKRVTKKIKRERIKCSVLSLISLFFGLVLSSIFNGDYYTYFKSKEHLKNYFVQEYHSGSRFKIVSSKYEFSKSPKFIFYTQDTVSNSVMGKFSVRLLDKHSVQDDYQEQLIKKVSNELNENINKEYSLDDIQVYVLNSDANELVISFTKQIETITIHEIEEYSKEIAECLDKISNVDKFDEIAQIKIVLESKNNSKENLASYIFMNGYKEMLEKGEDEPYLYIMRALNIIYFN